MRVVLQKLVELALENGAIDIARENTQIKRRIEQPGRILQHKRLHESRQVAAGLMVKESNQAKVMKADAAVSHDEQVAGVGIAMKYANRKELFEIRVDECLCQLRPVRLQIGIVDLQPGAHLLNADPFGLHVFDRVRHEDRGRVRENSRETANVACLVAEIHFLAQVLQRLRDQAQRIIAAKTGRDNQNCTGQECHDPHVLLDLTLDPGPAYFDNDFASIMQTGDVDLRDGRRRQRLRIERGKQLGDDAAE